ncbi:hypothetical protein [Actinomadura roseirufa]|uniref:hypothetical protein n=1 Tax=Actinomadura roseirufa TaxID=2094049 RepID=UPI001041AC1B|nr:hypothetical protein [Actinomadura roseirufa]
MADEQDIAELLEELDDLLDPASTLRRVEQAYTMAVVLMGLRRPAQGELAELAALLRRAADIADALGDMRL